MADAIPSSGGAPQLLAARLFAQATAQGTAILAEVAGAGPVAPAGGSADSRFPNSSPQPGQGTATPAGEAAQPVQPSVSAPVASVPATASPSTTVANTLPTEAGSLPVVATTPPAPNAASAQAKPGAPPPAAIVTLSAEARAALPAAPPSAPAPQTILPPALAQAVTTARSEAVIRQASPAPLMADLQAAVEADILPTPVRAAAQAVLRSAPPVQSLAEPASLKAAISGSGLFLESRLATPGAAPAATDLKAAVLVLAGRLREWVADAKLTTPAAEPEATLPSAGSEAEETPPRAQAAAKDALPPAPPVRGRPQPPQAPVLASLAAETTPEQAREVLLHRAEAALARQTLMQTASSRTAQAALGPQEAADTPTWMFELPVATPQGPAVLPFQISRDGGSGGGGIAPTPVTWRVAFALDLEPAGPVHVRAAFTGAEASITLRADRAAVAESLSGRLEDLNSSLAAQGLSARIAVLSGAPPETPSGAAGQFYSRAT